MPLRVIARLDVKAPNLVKGIRLEGLRVVGSPEERAQLYYEQGADEIYYQDIVASLYGRNSIKDLVKSTAEDLFVPLSVGGGLRSVEDVRDVLRAGADKVCINTVATQQPELISECAKRFGCQCITIAIETIRDSSGQWKAFTDNGREHTGLDAEEWALKAVELGAGELLLTSVDHEGRGRGFDLEFIKRVVGQVNVPVVAHGGAGSIDDVLEVADLGVDGVAIARVLHYDKLTIGEIKGELAKAGHEVRL